MAAVECNSFAEKERLNMQLESVKYKDLQFLKTREGPFTTSEEVTMYMDQIEIETKERNQILYVEVRFRYAKNTSLRLKHSDSFRLRRDNKNLACKEYAENLKT